MTNWETLHMSEPRDYDWTDEDMVDAHLEMMYEDRHLSDEDYNDDEYRSWYFEGMFWDEDNEDWDDDDEDYDDVEEFLESLALTDDE